VTHQTLVKDEIWSHAILRSGPADDGALTTDLRLFDSTGEPVADVAGLKLEPLAKVRPQEETVADWFYCLGWEVSAPNADEVGAPSSAGTWLIFADAQGVAERVVERLEVAGQACQVVENDALPSLRDDAALGEAIVRERLEQVLADDSTCCGVLYLRGLDATPTEVLTAEALMRDQYRAAGALLLVIQALAAVEGSEPPALWVATQGVMAIGETDRALALSQAPLWPLGRTAAAEHPRSWGGLIDLDPATDADTSAAELLQAVHAGDRENQVAYRGGERYVARLERRTVDVTRTLSLRPDGSYLITGGLKGIGYELARWMIDQGARHLILVGRTRLPDRMTWQTLDDTAPQIDLVRKVQALEEAGAEVMHPALDVTDEQQIVDFLEEHREQGRPPIRGVLHAASVWQDRDGKSLVRPLTQTELASIETIFPPKIVGAWLLQQHLRDQPVDFFKFFSAGAALLGSAGQGNYAAANGFLDTLAHELSRQGRKAVSCNWGPINGVGFSATDEGRMIHNLWERRGVKSISPAQVLEATGLLIAHGWPQAGVMCTDWDLLKQSYSETLSVPWYGKLVDVSVVQRKVDILAVLEQTEPSERLETFAEFLQSEVVAVMGFSAAEAPELDQGLFEMGLDSLLALELKNRIQSAVRRDFPVTAVFDYPTINALAGFLLRDILELSCGEETPLAAPESGDILSQIEDLSEEDVELLLARQLEEGHAEEGHTEAGGVSR
jgi:NAD(P)-dependent dehydrogenase (short-subunit alcohol dehydrogenase family)